MTYYDTIEEDLKRAKEILTKGKLNVHHHDKRLPPEYQELQGGVIYGGDIYAAYKLLESFVQYIERLNHALNNCEVHKDVPGIRERTACSLCLTEALQQRKGE